jgi:hypothetical protein
MSTGKGLAATAAVWVTYCYAMSLGAHAFERPADLWFFGAALSASVVATVLIWVVRR